MSIEKQTTESLRDILFSCIKDVKSKKMDARTAQAIVNLTDKIIKTAQLELEHSKTISRLDKDGQDVATGPLMLVNEKV